MKSVQLSLSLTAIKKGVFAFLHRFHVVVFVVLALGGLAVAVFILNGIIARSSEAGDYTSGENNTSFDQATIKRVEELKTSEQSGDLDLSQGRTNPFVE